MKLPSYYDLRKILSRVVPRERLLIPGNFRSVVDKGRKTNYREYKFDRGWTKSERLLGEDTMENFIKISRRVAACPMPMNLDVWDALICPYRCRYCFASAFRESLYRAMYDNGKTVGLRHCNANMYMQEMEDLFKCRGKDPHSMNNPISKGVSMEMPFRFGIRFEDFIKAEARKGVSLKLMRFLGENKYPFMLNSKSDLLSREDYTDALAKGHAAVHITLISSDEKLLKILEPGAPTYAQRLHTMRVLSKAGVRVVARIEPFMPFVNDHPDAVQQYMEEVWDAGVRHITFDTYSFTAKNPSIREDMRNQGIDLDRIVLVGCDSQPIGSLLLGAFMQMFKDKGFKCSTFDMGNVPDNNQTVCCEVGDWYKKGFNYGSSVYAARFIQSRGTQVTTWADFEAYVNEQGGFLSKSIKQEVHRIWNVESNLEAYGHHWARGMEMVGYDRGGTVWIWKDTDYRQDEYSDMLRSL